MAVLDRVQNEHDEQTHSERANLRGELHEGQFLAQSIALQVSTLGAGVVADISVSSIVSGAVVKDRLQQLLGIHKSEQVLTIGAVVWDDTWSLGTALECACLERSEPTVPITMVQIQSARHVALSGGRDGTLRLWDIRNDTGVRVMDSGANAGDVRSAVTCVALNLISQVALSGSEDSFIRYWNLGTGNVLHNIQGHSGVVACLAVDWKEQWAVTGGGDHALRLWKLPHGKLARQLAGHRGTVTCVALDAVHFQAYSGSMDRALRLWDLETGDCLKECLGHMTPVNCLAANLSARNAVSGGWATLKCWEIDVYGDGFNFKDLRGHTSAVTCVAVNWSTRSILTGSLDTTLCLYRCEWGDTPKILRRHTLPVNCLAWDVKRKRAVSGGGDGLWVWDMENDEALRHLPSHHGELLAVALDYLDVETEMHSTECGSASSN